LILMGPALSIPVERRETALARAAELEAGMMRDVVEASLGNSYPPIVQHNAEHYRQFRARWLANDPRSYAAINRMLVGMDLNPLCATVTCPVLVMAGRHDPLRSPGVVGPVARAIPGARFVEIESGHFMAVQTPDIVASMINQFLASIQPGNRPHG